MQNSRQYFARIDCTLQNYEFRHGHASGEDKIDLNKILFLEAKF